MFVCVLPAHYANIGWAQKQENGQWEWLITRDEWKIELRFEDDAEFKKKVNIQSIDECLQGNDGKKEGLNYQGVKVIGYHIWIPEQEVCLVTEISEEEDAIRLEEYEEEGMTE